MSTHLKIYFPHCFIGVPVLHEQTCYDVLQTILARIEAPPEQAGKCILLKQNKNQLHLINYHEQVQVFIDTSSSYLFRIVRLPLTEQLRIYDSKFLELIFHQINHYIIKQLWPIPSDQQEKLLQLAGIQCQLEFGQFKNLQHKAGFLKKTIQQFVPEMIISLYKSKQSDLEKKILNQWQSQSTNSLTKDQIVVNYLQFCKDNIQQYGYYIIDGQIDGVALKIGVSKKELLLYNIQGKCINNIQLKESMKIEQNQTKIKLQLNQTETNFITNFMNFEEIINNIKGPEYVQPIAQVQKNICSQLQEIASQSDNCMTQSINQEQGQNDDIQQNEDICDAQQQETYRETKNDEQQIQESIQYEKDELNNEQQQDEADNDQNNQQPSNNPNVDESQQLNEKISTYQEQNLIFSEECQDKQDNQIPQQQSVISQQTNSLVDSGLKLSQLEEKHNNEQIDTDELLRSRGADITDNEQKRLIDDFLSDNQRDTLTISIPLTTNIKSLNIKK